MATSCTGSANAQERTGLEKQALEWEGRTAAGSRTARTRAGQAFTLAISVDVVAHDPQEWLSQQL